MSSTQTLDVCLELLRQLGPQALKEHVPPQYARRIGHALSDDHDHDHDHEHDDEPLHDHSHSHGGGHAHDAFCNGLEGSYGVGLHIAAIFIVLVASAIGTVLPMLGKRAPRLRLPSYVYAVGKSTAIGVMLGVAMIHMINEAGGALAAECIPASFTGRYEGWAFLFAMIAAIFMHLLDVQLADIAEGWALRRQQLREARNAAQETAPCGHAKCDAEVCLDGPLAVVSDDGEGAPSAVAVAMTETTEARAAECLEEGVAGFGGGCGHQHAVAVPEDMSALQRVVAALCMEFGVTLHSVLVGLTLGVTPDTKLRPLLIALVFHQLFEGLAMGSRLADASFRLTVEVLLALVFSFSAPIGIAAGTGAVSANRDAFASTAYAMVCGILNSLCGGILLYLAFNLLFVDFPADLKRHGAHGMRHRGWKRFGMFAGLWIGAGVMAFIGKWM